MIYKTKKKTKDGSNVSSFCKLWRKKYFKKYKKPFLINWVRDTARFKFLLGTYVPRDLKKLILFAFSDCKETKFLKSTGYSIAAFVSQVNQFNLVIQKSEEGGPSFNDGLPYYEDQRFSLLVTSIQHSDMEFLIKNIPSSFKPVWLELIAEAKEAGDLKFVKKAKNCLSCWIRKEPFLRKRIKK